MKRDDQPHPQCQLCGRQVSRITRHHLVPRAQIKRRKRRTGSAPETDLVDLCSPCHRTIHAHLSPRELEAAYPTLEALRQHPDIARFVKWVRRQPARKRIAVRRPKDDR